MASVCMLRGACEPPLSRDITKGPMKRLQILSLANTRYVVEAYVETAHAAERLGHEVSHLGVALDLWYGGSAGLEYAKHSCDVAVLPRPSGNATPWWHSPDIDYETAASIPALIQFFRRTIREHRPDVFLISDDQGPIEATVIRLMNDEVVPVLLLEHGFGFSLGPVQRQSLLARTRLGARHFRAGVSDLLETRHPQPLAPRRRPSIPKVRPFGHNGRCTVCAYSGFTSAELVRHGVPRRVVRHTGFPYFDQIVRLAGRSPNHALDSRPQRRHLLVLSSGGTRFGWSDRRLAAWHRDLEIAKIAADSWHVTLRLHPGESIETLPDGIRFELLASPVTIDSADEAARDSLRSYNLLVGEPSTVHQEAAILGVPSVALGRPPAPPRLQGITTAELLEAALGMLVLRPSDDVEATLDAASRPEYGLSLADAVRRTGRLVYDNDGHAGERIAEVIVGECTPARTARNRLRPPPA